MCQPLALPKCNPEISHSFMRPTISIGILLLSILLTFSASGQKVGVVLSGGGSSAMAHVGFLKALEENDIPIDYICGTSMGAIIGAMYASGVPVAQIDSIVRSDDYQNMATGELDERYQYFFKEPTTDAAMATIKYGGEGSLLSQGLPTNLINPVLLDYKLMEGFSQAAAACNYDFDQLYIPFRCVAADIEKKKEVIFDKGHLNVAVRASATYPFYLHPIRVDGQLLYDGGLYNNFPVAVMDSVFNPDVILGCNVSELIKPPQEDDLISQIENMIRVKNNYTACCPDVIVVEPKTDLSTFDFNRIADAVNEGYAATNMKMEEILLEIRKRRTLAQKNADRQEFVAKFKPLVFDEITIDGLDRPQKNQVRKIVGKNEETVSIDRLKKNYFRAFADEKIRSIFPIAHYQEETGFFRLNLAVKKEKDLFVSFGGNFSSRPINTGFIGLRYHLFGKTAATFYANSYFGKYYGSVNARLRFDFNGAIPISIEPGITFNRLDYFRSFATFFEDVRPSFIVMNEQFAGGKIMTPAGNKGMLQLEGNYVQLNDDYYQTQEFISTDTADRTRFIGNVLELLYERNTLNRKQFANKGTLLRLKLKTVGGEEFSFPGTTHEVRDTISQMHRWFLAKFEYTNYFQKIGPVQLGIRLEGVANTQTFFENFIASVISAPAFNPIPESHTFFQNQFRAHNYAAGGVIASVELVRNLDLRGEGHMFVPFGRFVADENDQITYDYSYDQYFISSASLIYETPIGPLSFGVNYYDRKDDPWSILFNFGYLIYNKSMRE